jgi:hypothetical protein
MWLWLHWPLAEAFSSSRIRLPTNFDNELVTSRLPNVYKGFIFGNRVPKRQLCEFCLELVTEHVLHDPLMHGDCRSGRSVD